MTQAQQWLVGQLGVLVAFVGVVAQALIRKGMAAFHLPWRQAGAEGGRCGASRLPPSGRRSRWGSSFGERWTCLVTACRKAWGAGCTPRSRWSARRRALQIWCSWPWRWASEMIRRAERGTAPDIADDAQGVAPPADASAPASETGAGLNNQTEPTCGGPCVGYARVVFDAVRPPAPDA